MLVDENCVASGIKNQNKLNHSLITLCENSHFGASPVGPGEKALTTWPMVEEDRRSHFDVNNPSTPTGPRACKRPVAMPTFVWGVVCLLCYMMLLLLERQIDLRI
jgi:hypothetical protein